MTIDLLAHDVFRHHSQDPGAFRREAVERIVQRGVRTIFIDEIQRVPDLLNEVHSLIEEHRIRFIMTGSSARKLKRGGANLLAGRAALRRLHPLTLAEHGSRFDLDRTLRLGSLPRVVTSSETDALDVLRTYGSTYLREEIQAEAIVRNLGGFGRFLDVAAAQCGEILNYSSVARDAAIATRTVREYFQVLEDTLIGVRLDPWRRSERSRLVGHPRFYLFDTGVTNALSRRLNSELDPSVRGRLFEQWVILECIRWIDYTQSESRLFYWRTKDGSEVDLLVERHGEIRMAVEIKAKRRIVGADLTGLRSFAREHSEVPLFVAAEVPEPFRLESVEVLPYRLFLERFIDDQASRATVGVRRIEHAPADRDSSSSRSVASQGERSGMNPIKVFLSSTFRDNEERRKLVIKAITQLGMVPIGMELFEAREEPPLEVCLEKVKEADVLVGVLAWRYGWIPPGQSKSVTELEYEAATSRLVFITAAKAPADLETDCDSDERYRKLDLLDKFKKRAESEQTAVRFEEKTLFGEVLHSLNAWRERRGVRMPQPVYSATSAATAPLAAEIDAYLNAAETLHSTMTLVGFDTKLRVPIRLEEMHVPLQALLDSRGDGDAGLRDADEAERRHGPGRPDTNVPLIEAFACAKKWGDRRGVVILGDPGAGKTTHMKRVLLQAAHEGAPSLGLPPDTVPVLLSLRDLEDADADLAAFVDRSLTLPPLSRKKGFGKKLLKRGNVFLLIDGLDEVRGGKRRKEVARWIQDALVTHADWRFLVTSRYAGYTNDVRFDAHFLEMHLRPLDKEQAEEFVRRWYRIVESAIPGDPEQAAAKAAESAEDLIRVMNSPDYTASKVTELTRNPLLLTTICLVHRDRGKLPRHRAKLYEEAVNILLERWRDAKKMPVTFGAGQAKAVLQPVAHFLHSKEGRTRATADELAPVVKPALAEVLKKGDVEPKAFLETIRDESGLLTGWSGDAYGFLHLGFQEYLTAREIWSRSKDPKVIAEIAGRFGQSWWREVILLLLAQEDFPVFEEFMRELVKRPAFAERSDLVTECLGDSARWSAAPFVELLKKPPGRQDADGLWARQLAALRVLTAIAPDELKGLTIALSQHPSREIRDLVSSRTPARYLVERMADIDAVRIPGGVFWMGSPPEEAGRGDNEGPVHEVAITGFFLGKTTVTNEQYDRFMAETRNVSEPDYWSNRRFNQPRQPVVGVSWEDAKRFCEWVGGRLPTEAQWEYACRAETRTRFWSGDSEEDLKRVAWFGEGSSGAPHPVGGKPASPFGLHDMHGNVWEWCADWYGEYSPRKQADPTGPKSGSHRVLRGGSYWDGAVWCRSACRFRSRPDVRFDGIGFRVAWPAAPSS